MPDPSSLDLTNITSAVGGLTSGASNPKALDQMFASGSTATSLDMSGMQDLLKQAAQPSSGPSIMDPSYLIISGSLSLLATGFLIYGKKMGELRFIFWGLGLFALSYDYTSGPVWAVTAIFGVAGYLFE